VVPGRAESWSRLARTSTGSMEDEHPADVKVFEADDKLDM
jgi:hypothetical protein